MDRLAQIQNFSLNAPNQFANLTSITFPNLLRAVITGVMVIAAIVFFFMLIVGGIRWITSGGDKTQTESARGQITAALIGLVIVFSAWAIVTLVNAFFGINILSLNITNVAG